MPETRSGAADGAVDMVEHAAGADGVGRFDTASSAATPSGGDVSAAALSGTGFAASSWLAADSDPQLKTALCRMS